MELLLNLLWLFLAAPAIWMWRRANCRQLHSAGHSRRCVLVLACLLTLLFPVISATDDLQAMRPELEEAATRDGVQNSSHGRLSTLLDGVCGSCALSAGRASELLDQSLWGEVAFPAVLRPAAVLKRTHTGRAPPLSFLG